ncbi:hypothetical protein [Xanthomonas floridensis]|uniref:Uncharacterized protein n=2 Tax=Xanthomonas floridensis TaxID=1843580 RepID=A0A1A9MEP3_9XANT|nr:hypothetical protein [Xanthomonas floridensis]MEA5124116.1 hypothetical protein [Xanthomonas floridensis]MEA5132011.1 hypothetical protein [Xanthomonas floridensis]OAG69004.1 hypothetical protein A7D17_10390 [Xanthomonas floridensis]
MPNAGLLRRGSLVLMLLMPGACRLPPLDGGGQVEAAMDTDRVLIARVQGDAYTSPLLGQDVVIEGIVTRSLAGDQDDLVQEVGEALGEGNRGKVVGWFVQDEGDGLTATSDAVFVLDQGYDTGLGMPGETEYTTRLGARVRSGDRVKVRGVVTELAQDIAAEQLRSSGHPVGRGDPAGHITAIRASWITLLSQRERRPAIVLVDTVPTRSTEEATEAMRLAAPQRVAAGQTQH